MNEVSVFVYLTFFIGIFGMTFAFMWKMMSSTLRDFDKPQVKSYNDTMRAYKPHPEMEDVKDGDELLIFRASEDPDDK